MTEPDDNEQLAEAYRATTYHGMPPGEPNWQIRIDEPSPVDGPMAYVTSDNPGSNQLPDHRNRQRRSTFRADLRASGIEYIPGKSVADDGNWPDEHGVWLLDVDQSSAVDIARRYGQNAIVWIDETGTVTLVYC